jgi:predicted HNH restriction endonuclease
VQLALQVHHQAPIRNVERRPDVDQAFDFALLPSRASG